MKNQNKKPNNRIWDVFFIIMGSFLFLYEGVVLPLCIRIDWLSIALAFLGLICFAYGIYEWRKGISLLKCLPKGIRYIIQVVLVCCLSLFLFLEGLILTQTLQEREADSKYVLVLGALVNGDQITDSLRYRLEAAVELYEAYPDYVFIVSGGKGPHENNTESYYMKAYLLERGIPAEQIIEEDKSRNTYENMLFTKRLLEERGDGEASIIIVSNAFHLYRSRYLAEVVGFQKISTYGAKMHGASTLHYYIRESFALAKDFLFH